MTATASTGDGWSVVLNAVQLTKLTPFDGLFLQAEHLATLSSYAEALVAAVGRAGGSGTVHGLTARDIGTGQFSVDPGLAIDGFGLPLLVDSALTVDPRQLTPDQMTSITGGEISLLELVGEAEAGGDSVTSTDVGVDPLGATDATRRPYRRRAARLRCRAPRWTAGQVDVAPARFRSSVASAWFRSERQDANVLRTDRPADSATWREGTLPPDIPPDGAVPLALLLRAQGQSWEVDQWVVRRDRLDRPPVEMWQSRLGERPRSAFLAELFQFQAQLANLADPLLRAGRASRATSFLTGVVDEIKQTQLGGFDAATRTRVESIVDEVRSRIESAARSALFARGIVELPPVAILPADTSQPVSGELSRLLGNAVGAEFQRCGAGEIPGLMWLGDHRPRIPLGEAVTREVPVQVYVPHDESGDRPSSDEVGTQPAPLGWVLLVRSGDFG